MSTCFVYCLDFYKCLYSIILTFLMGSERLYAGKDLYQATTADTQQSGSLLAALDYGHKTVPPTITYAESWIFNSHQYSNFLSYSLMQNFD